MLKAFQKWGRWQISFCTPDNKEWDGDFVGNVYRTDQLKKVDDSDSYEFYYCDPGTLEIIQMFFRNQKELMKFLTCIGKDFRARYNSES